jgi:hypothetical protein
VVIVLWLEVVMLVVILSVEGDEVNWSSGGCGSWQWREWIGFVPVLPFLPAHFAAVRDLFARG